MRKDNLHRALQQPELLSEEQLQELRDTVTRFPYFGAAQIALSQAYKVKGDHRFSDQLSQAAIYTSNRASLYERLKRISEEPADPAIEVAAETEITPNIPAHTPSILASSIVDEEVAVAPSDEEMVAAPEAKPVAPIIEHPAAPTQEIPIQSLNTATEEEPQEHPIADISMDSFDPLEAQILIDAVQKSIEMEVQPEHEDQVGDADSLPDLTPDDENSYAALIYKRAQRMQQSSAQEESDTDDEIEPIDYSDDDLPAFQSTPLSHGIQRIKPTGAKQHQRDLIDRFIHLEPQIARGKASDYAAGNVAKDSLEEDFSFVTETMAVLFAKQGKLDKARKAFRKLMEQHPEKSIYFATQLKNLEHFKK